MHLHLYLRAAGGGDAGDSMNVKGVAGVEYIGDTAGGYTRLFPVQSCQERLRKSAGRAPLLLFIYGTNWKFI